MDDTPPKSWFEVDGASFHGEEIWEPVEQPSAPAAASVSAADATPPDAAAY